MLLLGDLAVANANKHGEGCVSKPQGRDSSQKSGAQSHINLYGSHLSHPYRYIQAQLAKIQVIIHSGGLTLERNYFNKVLFYLWQWKTLAQAFFILDFDLTHTNFSRPDKPRQLLAVYFSKTIKKKKHLRNGQLSKVLRNSDAWREAQNVYLRGGNEAELKERSQQMVQWKHLGTTGHPVPQSEGKGNTSHREELKVLDVKRKLLFVLSLMTLS